MIATPTWADAITDGAAKGQAVGAEVRTMLQNALPQSTVNGQPIAGNGTGMELKDLFPGSAAGSTQDYEKVFGDDAGTLQAGTNANSTLANEASETGEAYRTLKKGRQNPNLKNDPIITKSSEVMNNLTVFEKEFTDCKADTKFSEINQTKHLPDYRTCERVKRSDGPHVLVHDYGFVTPIEAGSGETSVESCGDGCSTVSLGKVGNNYLSGSCTVYEMGGSLLVRDASKIQSVTLEYVKYDDYIQVIIGNEKVWDGPIPNQFPPETAGTSCNDLALESEASPNRDLTHKFLQNGTIPFKIRVSVSGAGEAYARLKVRYNPSLVPVKDEWRDQAAVDAAKGISDGFCAGSALVCDDMPQLDANGCTQLNGVRVCQNDVIPSPYPSLNPLCRRASFSADCGFNEGPMECYTDAQGNEVCPANGGETCGVNHNLILGEQAVSVELAAQGRLRNTFRFNLVSGTWQQIAPSDGLSFEGHVDKVDFDSVCGPRTKALLHYTGNEWWSGFTFEGQADTTSLVTIKQAPSCENGLVGVVELFDNSSDRTDWDGFALAVSLKYKVLTVKGDTWGHSTCVESAQSVANGTCPSGKLTVTKGPSNSGGCTTISGVQVCPGDPFYNLIGESPIPGVDRLVQQVRVDGCVKQPTRNNTCETYEQNPNCGFISSKCIDGAEGASGNCYATEEKWDCGQDVAVPKIEANTKYACAGAVRCLGEECGTQGKAKSADFGEAVAALQVAQFAGADMNCGQNADGSNADPSACTIFKGEPLACKKALGGWVDCCDQPAGVSLADYVNLTLNSMKVMQASGNLAVMQPVAGAWSSLTQPVMNSWDKVTSAISSAADSAMGTAVEQGTEAATAGMIDTFQQKLIQKAYEWTAETFGSAAGNAMFATTTTTSTDMATGTQTTTTTATGLNSTLMSAMSVVMWVYTVYVIVDLLVNIIYECEKDEYALASKKEVKVCHLVGSYCASKQLGTCIEKRESYCCFNSPVARILQEQIRPQLGMSWGEPKSPQCGGIAVGDLSRVDWSKVDLSEWLAILKITDNYPTADKMNLDNLTGAGNALNVNGNRLDASQRATDKLQGVDAADIRQEVQNQR